MGVGDHENGLKNNHGGAVEDVTMRKYVLREKTVFPRWTYQRYFMTRLILQIIPSIDKTSLRKRR